MIPQRTKDAIDRYVNDHCRIGGFLKAVLSNDLVQSFGLADEENRKALFEIVSYVYNEIPGNSWGSPEKVANWIAARDADSDHVGT